MTRMAIKSSNEYDMAWNEFQPIVVSFVSKAKSFQAKLLRLACLWRIVKNAAFAGIKLWPGIWSVSKWSCRRQDCQFPQYFILSIAVLLATLFAVFNKLYFLVISFHASKTRQGLVLTQLFDDTFAPWMLQQLLQMPMQ